MLSLNKNERGCFVIEESLSHEAYWISDKGKMISVPNKHINVVLSNPEMFGYTDGELDTIYDKYKEPRGLEGKAREEIMLNLIKKGFIRIRYNKKASNWIVQLDKLDKRKKDYLQQWSEEMLKTKFKYSDVTIMTNTSTVKHSMDDISNDILFNESDKKDNDTYILDFVEKLSVNDKVLVSTKRTHTVEYDDYSMVFESSLSRVWKHQKNGFIMMSSFIPKVSQNENMKRHARLKKRLKELKLGFFEIDGAYQYDDGHVENELSVFIPFNSNVYDEVEHIEIAKKLLDEFDQEAVVFKKPDGNALLLYKNKTDIIGTGVGFDTISTVYSRLRKGAHKGRTFTLEGIRVPSSHVSALAMHSANILWF